jgi:hypothetical protein
MLLLASINHLIAVIFEFSRERFKQEAARLDYLLSLDKNKLREADIKENTLLAAQGLNFDPDGGDSEVCTPCGWTAVTESNNVTAVCTQGDPDSKGLLWSEGL